MKAQTNITTFSREHDLAAPVARYFRNRAFRLQRSELPFYEYRIDMYVYSQREDVTIAVELKLTKWSRAFEQCLLYQLCSDLVYIAMPETEVKRVNLKVLDEEGIGLLAVREDKCREILRPIASKVLRRHYRADYLELLRDE